MKLIARLQIITDIARLIPGRGCVGALPGVEKIGTAGCWNYRASTYRSFHRGTFLHIKLSALDQGICRYLCQQHQEIGRFARISRKRHQQDGKIGFCERFPGSHLGSCLAAPRNKFYGSGRTIIAWDGANRKKMNRSWRLLSSLAEVTESCNVQAARSQMSGVNTRSSAESVI